MDVTEREMDPDIGSEFFSEQMYYSLSRETRAELSREWTKATGELSPIERYVGRVEDVLWGRGKYKLARAVVAAAQTVRESRFSFMSRGMVAPVMDIPEDNFAGEIPETPVAAGTPMPVEWTPGVDTTAPDSGVAQSVDEIRDALRVKGGA